MLQTVNQLLKLIKDTSENHNQVNKFLFAKDWDFETEGQVKYPLVGVALVQPAQFITRVIEYDFTIWVADLVKKDRSNELEVLSDTIQIAVDIVSDLIQNNQDDEMEITQNISYTPFTEKWDSEVSGWTFELKIRVPSINNECQIPKK